MRQRIRAIQFLRLDGGTSAKKRPELIRSFQSGECDVFLISTKAGNAAITLTAADTVVFLDPWWNAAVEDQASARAHRIGQTRPVTAYRLIAQDTIEEFVMGKHDMKRALAAGVLEGSGFDPEWRKRGYF